MADIIYECGYPIHPFCSPDPEIILGNKEPTTAPIPIKKVWIENPVVCCSSGSISPTKARKGSIVTLMEASMIINIPAPINTGDKIAVSVPGDKNNPAFGINIKAIVVKIAPTRKNGRRRPKRHHVWSE